jgi:hypothetical protein
VSGSIQVGFVVGRSGQLTNKLRAYIVEGLTLQL